MPATLTALVTCVAAKPRPRTGALERCTPSCRTSACRIDRRDRRRRVRGRRRTPVQPRDPSLFLRGLDEPIPLDLVPQGRSFGPLHRGRSRTCGFCCVQHEGQKYSLSGRASTISSRNPPQIGQQIGSVFESADFSTFQEPDTIPHPFSSGLCSINGRGPRETPTLSHTPARRDKPRDLPDPVSEVLDRP